MKLDSNSSVLQVPFKRLRPGRAYATLIAAFPLPAMLLKKGIPCHFNVPAHENPTQTAALVRFCKQNRQTQSLVYVQKQWVCVWVFTICEHTRLVCWQPSACDGLLQTIKQLRANEKNATQFETSIAGLAHDIRTPLNIISGLSQLLGNELAGTASSRAQGWISLIRTQTDQINRLVEEVIDVVRISHGVLSPKRVKGDIVAHIHAQSKMLHPLFVTHNISLIMPDPSKHFLMEYDHLMFERMMQNLLSNAVRFTPSGGHIEICFDPMPDGVRISITDSGCGIDPSLAQDLFELHKTGSGGYGLGLYLTRAMAQAHGGDVTALPHNCGAHFVLTLKHAARPRGCPTR